MVRVYPAALALLVSLGATGVASAQETPLDARKKTALLHVDHQFVTKGAEPRYPAPNATLENAQNEDDYQSKALAIFALVEMGAQPAARLDEANRLLRYAWLGRYRADSPSDVRGQYPKAWGYRAKTSGMRIHYLYERSLDADLQKEIAKRMSYLVQEPFDNLSENIKFCNNAGFYLGHEATRATSAPSWPAIRRWVLENLKNFGRDGAKEWGTTYNEWTLEAVLNLAEFAADPEVKNLATACVDYFLARQSAFMIGGHYCSGAVRRYGHWLYGYTEPQTRIDHLYFGGADPFTSASFAASNYRPLSLVETLHRDAPGESRFTESKWRLHVTRSKDVAIATIQQLEDRYYVANETHNEVGCSVRSRKGGMVVPVGYPSGPKWRSTVDRSFGYKNVAFVNNGGFCTHAWTAGRESNVPTRVFYSKGWTVSIEGGWAFMTDGAAYVAWAPTVGQPLLDPDGDALAPSRLGAWVRSSNVPGDEGETCVVEVGDSASSGSFDEFKREILVRNARPSVQGGRVSYTAKDGAVLTFGPSHASVDGVAFDPEAHPRAESDGISGTRLSAGGASVTFDFAKGTTTGALGRMAAKHVFGSAPPAPPPQGGPPSLATTSVPAGRVGVLYGPVTLAASGGSGTYVRFSVIQGELPPGLALDGAKGVLSGTPTKDGTYDARIRVADSAGAVGSRLLKFVIEKGKP